MSASIIILNNLFHFICPYLLFYSILNAEQSFVTLDMHVTISILIVLRSPYIYG